MRAVAAPCHGTRRPRKGDEPCQRARVASTGGLSGWAFGATCRGKSANRRRSRTLASVCARELAERTPLPLISLLDAIIAEISRRRLARVAVFGARFATETGFFGRLQDVTDVIYPDRKKSTASAGAPAHPARRP